MRPNNKDINIKKVEVLDQDESDSDAVYDLIDKLEPSTSLKVVNRRLDETSEGRRLLDASYHIPLVGISNVVPYIEKLEKGASLAPEDLSIMSDFFRGCKKVKLFIKDKEGYAVRTSYAEEMYTEVEANSFTEGYISILESALEGTKQIKDITVLTPEEQAQINSFNDTEHSYEIPANTTDYKVSAYLWTDEFAPVLTPVTK